MRSSTLFFCAVLAAAFVAGAVGDAINLGNQNVQVTHINDRAVQTDVVRQQIWIQKGKIQTIRFKTTGGSMNGYAISLQTPWDTTTPIPFAPCDGKQTITAGNTFPVTCTGSTCTATIDTTQGTFPSTNSADELYICMSSGAVTINTADIAMPHHFTIDTLFSLWAVATSHTPASNNKLHAPCVCDITCTVRMTPQPDCSALQLFGPVAPPVTSNDILNFGGVQKSWTPPNAAYGTDAGFIFGLPKAGTASPDWWMPISVVNTGVYATRGPFHPAYRKNGGWTISFVSSATSCGLGATTGTIVWSSADPLNWYPDNRTSITFGATSQTVGAGTLGWTRINANVASALGLLCYGVSATGASPDFQPTGGVAARHDFLASSYRVQATSVTLSRFGGPTAAGDGIVGVAGAPQREYSPGKQQAYATDHVNVEVDFGTATFDLIDTPSTVNGATVLVSLQKNSCSDPLTGTATPTFVEVRAVSSLGAAGQAAGDYTRKAFARLYYTQLSDAWIDLKVCYAVVPVWYHRFNRFGSASFYGPSGSTYAPSSPAQIYFPTPDVASDLETAQPSMFVDSNKKFTVIPHQKVCRVETFGRRTGESCNAVGLVDGEGNQGIPVTTTCSLDGDKIGTYRFADLVDIVFGLAIDDQCRPFSSWGTLGNALYSVQRMPARAKCTGTTGRSCTWSAIQACNYADKWLATAATAPCYNGRSSFTGFNIDLVGGGASPSGHIAQLNGGRICVAVVPKMATDNGWHASGFDYNDMLQASKFHRKLVLHMVERTRWSAVTINTVPRTGLTTTGAIVNQAQIMPVTLKLDTFGTGTNCPLNAFQIHFCLLRGAFSTTATPSAANICTNFAPTARDCALVWGCGEDNSVSGSPDVFHGWMNMKATAAGEAIVCAQISSSYGYDATNNPNVANTWNPTSSPFDAAWLAKSPFSPDASNGLFFAVAKPTIQRFGGVAPTSDGIVGLAGDIGYSKFIPVDVDDTNTYMPKLSEFTITSGIASINTARTTGNAGLARVPVVDLAVTLTDKADCSNFDSISHYTYGTTANTFVARSMSKDWGNTITAYNSDAAKRNYPSMAMVRPNFQAASGQRAAHGPAETNARVCLAWIPAGFTQDELATTLTSGTTPSQPVCFQAIAANKLTYEPTVRIRYSQVAAPARMNFVRDTCGSIGTKYFKIPVFAYDATGKDITGKYQNVSIFFSLQEDCQGQLPPLNALAAQTTATTAPYPYTLYAGLAVADQRYQSIASDSLAYPTRLTYDNSNGRLYYEGYIHHYVSTAVCVVVAPSWKINSPSTGSLGSIWTGLYGAAPVQTASVVYGIDKDAVYTYRLTAADFNDVSARDYPAMRLQKAGLTGTTNVFQGATRFSAIPPQAVPQLYKFAGSEVNRPVKLYMPSVASLYDPSDAAALKRVTLFGGIPRFNLEFQGGLQNEVYNVDTNYQLILNNETCGTITPWFATNYAEKRLIPSACCNQNTTMYNYVSVSYAGATDASSTKGSYVEFPLTTSFSIYNNRSNDNNETVCLKVCRSLNPCGEIPSAGNFTDLTNVEVCIVPERKVRTQRANVPATVILGSRVQNCFNFTNDQDLIGLTPYVSFQTSDTCNVDWTSVGNRFATPMPLDYDVQRGWCLKPDVTNANFWTDLRAKADVCLTPCFTAMQANLPIGGTENANKESVVAPEDFVHAALLRKAAGIPEPTCSKVYAPTCDEYELFLRTDLPPKTAATCTSFRARTCPTIINMFGKTATGPRLLSLADTCNTIASHSNVNMATIVGAGAHEITLNGYNLDRLTTWVSLQPVTTSSRPCVGKTPLTGISAASKVTLKRDCSNNLMTTDMWGRSYGACSGQQYGSFTVNVATTDIDQEFAVCVAFLPEHLTPLSSDFNDHIDTFQQQLATQSSANSCPMTTCAHPISLHVKTIARSRFSVNCVGSCAADRAYAPAASQSQLPIQVVRSVVSGVAVPEFVQPDIWVALEPYHPNKVACRGMDIISPASTCLTHTAARMTQYYPIRVQQGFSDYNPGFSTAPTSWGAVSGNYSLTLDALRTPEEGRYTLCYAVLSNGVVPQAKHFTTGYFAASPTCALNLVKTSPNVVAGQTDLNVCAKNPRGWLQGLTSTLDTYVSLQTSSRCDSVNAVVRGSDESYVKVSPVDANGRSYYYLPKRSQTYTALTVCVAQVACGALPTPYDFRPASNGVTLRVIQPTKLSFPSSGLSTFTCDPTTSSCTSDNVGFHACKERSVDTGNTCVYAAAGCPVARCGINGVCASPSIPVRIQDVNNVNLYEGCSIQVVSTNKKEGGFVNVTNGFLNEGLFTYNEYYQKSGEECNSYYYEVDCGCGTNITGVTPFSVKTQFATTVDVPAWPTRLFLPADNDVKTRYQVGYNSSLERTTALIANVFDANKVNMVGDVLSTATVTAVVDTCTVSNAMTNPNCAAASCISIAANNATIGVPGPAGAFNFLKAVVNPLLGSTSCNVRLLVTVATKRCVLGADRIFYVVSPTIPVETLTSRWSQAVARQPTNAPADTNAPIPNNGDAAFATPAPPATLDPATTMAPGATSTPVPTAVPYTRYTAGNALTLQTIPSIASYPSLATDYGYISNFQVCPGRHADKCATTLTISMNLNGPARRKNDGSNSNPQIVIKFPVVGDEGSLTCRVTHAVGGVSIVSHKGFNVNPASASWDASECELTLNMGCSQVTGAVTFTVADFTFAATGDPGVYPSVVVRDRSYDLTSPPNIVLYRENVNPTCDEIGPIIDNFDVNILDDSCNGKANLEVCFTTTNEVQAQGGVSIGFQGSTQFTHAVGNVVAMMTKVSDQTARLSNVTASWTAATATTAAVLKIINRDTKCWAPGKMCFKVMDFNVPAAPTTNPGTYCASTFKPSGDMIDQMMLTGGARCMDAASDVVNSITDLKVTTPNDVSVGDVNVPLTFSFTLARGLDAQQCVTIDVPYFKNNQGVVPLYTGSTTSPLSDVSARTGRYMNLIDGVSMTRSDENANPARFLKATYTNNANCGGQLTLCSSCAIGGGSANGTDFCTRLSFQVENFFAPTDATCTDASMVPFSTKNRLVSWKVTTPALTNNAYDAETVFSKPVLGTAKLQVTQTYAGDATKFPYNRYAREAHAAYLSLFFTVTSTQSLNRNDVIKITFPCEESKKYFCDALQFENSPSAYCAAGQTCTHSCLQAPTCSMTGANNGPIVSVTVACPIEAGTMIPFTLAPFTSPIQPAAKENFKFQLDITSSTGAIVDSGKDIIALTHDVEGIANFDVKTSSCVAGAPTTLTIGMTVSRTITNAAIVVVFPDNTYHPSYSTLLRESDGVHPIGAYQPEGLIPLKVSTAYANDYEVYWRNQTFEYWTDNTHNPNMMSTRQGDRDQALVIYPKNNRKFSSNTILLNIEGLVNPWKRSWDTASFNYNTATQSTNANAANTNPSGAYRGNWQFKRVEYRADAYNADGTKKSAINWFMASGENLHVHLPVLRTQEWYNANRATRLVSSPQLTTLYTPAPQPYWNPAPGNVNLNYPTLATATAYNQYASEAKAAMILAPAGAATGIRDLTVTPSVRTIGSNKVYLTVSFRTCVSLGRSGRIDIQFGVQEPKDGFVLTGSVKDVDMTDYRTQVTQFAGKPFTMAKEGPVSVEDGTTSGKMYNGYFRKVWGSGVQQAGGILSITGLDQFDCGATRSDQWTFIIGKDFGSFSTNVFPYDQAQSLAPSCFDPGFYQIATYSMGCQDSPATCGGSGNTDRTTCGEKLLELSTYMNPTTDELTDDTLTATTAFVDIAGDKRLGQRMPCTIDTTLKFTAKFRKQVKEGDTLKYTFPANSFRHSVDAAVVETPAVGYRKILRPGATWDAATSTLTVTFDRTFTSCSLNAAGECITYVEFTVDGFKNPVKSGKIGNMTASLTVAAGTYTSAAYDGVAIEALQFTATLMNPKVNAISDVLFEFPSIPCNVAPGDMIKVTLPSSFSLQASPVAIMPTVGVCSTTQSLGASTNGQVLTLTVPSTVGSCAACGINNCRKLMHSSGVYGLQGMNRNCGANNGNQQKCVDAGCVYEVTSNVCRDGHAGRISVDNFVTNSQLTQTMLSGFRVLVQNLVQNPPRPGDPGKYELTVTSADGTDMLWSGSINPSDENIEENTDLVHGLDYFDIKPSGKCTWCDSRDGRSVALEMSFINYGSHRFAAPGSSASLPVVSPFNSFNTGSNSYAQGTDFSKWREGRMHQIEVCFPHANYSYTFLGRGQDRLKRTFSPLNYFAAATTCTTDVETDWTIPVQFVPTPKFNDGQTTHIPIDGDWFSMSTAAAATRSEKIEGVTASRKNTLFAAWTSERCVLMETYENVVGGKYTFILGAESNMDGFSQGTPLPDDAMSGKRVDLLGPQNGIIRDNVSAIAAQQKYTVTLRNRYDDVSDASVNVNTAQGTFPNSQCKAPVQILSVQFVPPTDKVCSGVADFDVVPSKASAGATDVWLTFSMTLNVAMTQSSGMDIVFPPASFYRPLRNKCSTSNEEIEVEVLSHTQIGQASAYSSRIVATAYWIINPSDYTNQQTSGRDLFAGRLRLNFTRSDSWQPIEAGYLVFRVGGFINPKRVGDPSRPTSGPYGKTAEYWVGYQWYNNRIDTDWKVEVYEYSFGDKNTRTLSLGASTQGTAACTGTLAGGVRTSVVARGSMNAPSDWIGTLYCGVEGIKLADGSVRSAPFDVLPSRNSINNAAEEKDLTLEFSMCVRRDIPVGSRIVIRLPADSFTAPSCGRSLNITSEDSHAPGLKTASVFVDNGVLSTVYDASTSNSFGTDPTKMRNDNAGVNYGFNRYEPELVSTATSTNEQHLEWGSYAGNTNGAYEGSTLTIIVGEGGVMVPERPKWYDMSATTTLTSTKNDLYGMRGPSGVRLFTFKISGFQAPCSVKTYTTAVGTYADQDLPTADLGEYDVRVEYGSDSLLTLRNTRVQPCTDSTLQSVFTMKNFYTGINSPLWTILRNDQSEMLYPNVEILMKAWEHPLILQTRNDITPSRGSNFVNSPSNPPSDAVWGITESYNFNFEVKILSVENDRTCGANDYNKAGTGFIDPSKYKLGSNQRLQFSLELPSCFVSRPTTLVQAFKTGLKLNENDGDKLTIKFPQNTYQHECGKVDLSNVPTFYEKNFYNRPATGTTPIKAVTVDPWANVFTGAGDSYVRITARNNDADLMSQGTNLVELLSAEWDAESSTMSVLGPLADWRIAQPIAAPQCGRTRRHVVKFEACCFQLPTTFADPGAFQISYKKRTKRSEDMVTLLSQVAANPKCDAVPNPASCESMWGGCGDNMKECTTGMGSDARCVCIPHYAECCNATHAYEINRASGLYAGNAAAGVVGGVRAYCDKFTETCAQYEDVRLGRRCSRIMVFKPRARAFAIAMPTIFFFAIIASLVVIIFLVREQLAAIVVPLLLSLFICGFASVALLSVEFYTALGFAFLAIFNVFAAHPQSNSKYMLVCLIVEGLMLLSFFSTSRVIPTRTGRPLLPVYENEQACIDFYGHFAVDPALIALRRDSPSVVGRRLCSRSFMMTLDIMFIFIIACFVLLWFVNLYFYMKQKESETTERRERRSQQHQGQQGQQQPRDMEVRTLTAQSGEALPPADEVQLENEAVN